jgi:hypothetical protein
VYRFHATLHAAPAICPAKIRREINGQVINVLDIAAEELAANQFSCSFEEVASRLDALDRMHVEPDGSFVWVSGSDEPHWQIDGNLYDRAGKLQHVDLKGSCTLERFDELLRGLGWPQQQLVFQLVSSGLVVDEQEFRRWTTIDAEPKA